MNKADSEKVQTVNCFTAVSKIGGTHFFLGLLALMALFYGTIAFAEDSSDFRLRYMAEEYWNRTEINNAAIHVLPTKNIFPHRFPLTIVIDRSSRWNIELIEEYIRVAERVYSQCQISIFPVSVIEINHPLLGKFGRTDDYVFTRDLPPGVHRPMVVFTSVLRGLDSSAYANMPFFPRHEHESLSFFTAFVQELSLEQLRKFPDYSDWIKAVVAHELGHIFLNAGHINSPGNLMHEEWVSKREDLTESQCQKIKNHELVTQNL